jgi:hypothetical protein
MPRDLVHPDRDDREHPDDATRPDRRVPGVWNDLADLSHGQLTDVLVSERLRTQPVRSANLESENEFLHSLAQHLLTDPEHILERSIRASVRLCGAGSAGISLLETDEGHEVFRWVALGGAFEGQEGRVTPRFASPCGFAIESQAPQLFSYPARYFPCLHGAGPEMVEELVVPLPDGTGTIWIVAHDEGMRFDGEHVRLLTGLATFMATSLRLLRLTEHAKGGHPETKVDRTPQYRLSAAPPSSGVEFTDAFEVQLSLPLRVDLMERRDATDATLEALNTGRDVVVADEGGAAASVTGRTETHQVRLAYGALIEQIRLVVRDGRRLIRQLALYAISKRRSNARMTSSPAPRASVPLIVLRPTTAREQIELDELVRSLKAEGYQVAARGGRRVVFTEIADRRGRAGDGQGNTGTSPADGRAARGGLAPNPGSRSC